jgi:hypothetical protein
MMLFIHNSVEQPPPEWNKMSNFAHQPTPGQGASFNTLVITIYVRNKKPACLH